jgi:ribosomal protein L5
MYEVWAQDSPNSNPMDLVHIANVVVSACTQYALHSHHSNELVRSLRHSMESRTN